MVSRFLIPAHLAVAGLLVAAPILDDAALRFAPEAGTTLVKTFATSMEMELDDLTVIVDGEDALGGLGVPQVRVQLNWDVTVADEYLAVAEGRPTRLVRHFEALELRTRARSVMLGESDTSDERTGSELEGRSVLFTWDGDADEYRTAWAEGASGNAALLADLKEDMDLRFLLPAGAVEPGAAWTLPLERVLELFMPGGDLAWQDSAEDGEFGEALGQIFDNFDISDLGSLLRGVHEVTYVGTRVMDGRRLGVLNIELDLSGDVDMAAMMGDLSSLIGGGELDVDLDIEVAELRAEVRAKGEALWDLGGDFLHSLDVSGDFALDIALQLAIEFFGERQSIELEAVVSGLLGSKVSTATR